GGLHLTATFAVTSALSPLPLLDALPIFARVALSRRCGCGHAGYERLRPRGRQQSAAADSPRHVGHRPPQTGIGASASAGCESARDRKSTRLSSSHVKISYAVFCLKTNN